MKLAYCVCGSFCTHQKSLAQLEKLCGKHDVFPVVSEISASTDTRFGTASDLISRLTELTGKTPLYTIREAEEIITRGRFDAVVVCPCTGNTLAKIACGITDTVVTMTVKAQLRNRLPVVLAVATNDGLSANLFNFAAALEKKHLFLVPFGQDDPVGKPSSLVCDFERLEETIEAAVAGKQVQPILTGTKNAGK